MARTKLPKTNGVKEPVPATDTARVETLQAEASPRTVQAAPVAVEKAEAVTQAEPMKPKAVRNPAPKLEAVKSEPRNNVVPINLEDEIRKLAYLFSERRGFEPGHESEDWLAAENEVLQRYRQQTAQSA
jgi:hypothetical protein